jgi:predicted GTPase
MALLFFSDYNTDEETDELLERQYSLNDKQAVSDSSHEEMTGQVRNVVVVLVGVTQASNLAGCDPVWFVRL